MCVHLDCCACNGVCFCVNYRTTGLSPRRDLSRKLCRSPYFMKGRMTMGLGKRSDSTSKHTPGGNKSANAIKASMWEKVRH